MPLIPITAEQAQSYEMGQNAPAAALQQPGASLGQTIQSTQTSGAEAANLQAQNPGVQATSQQDIIKAQQAAAPQNLAKDLANKMTLSDALKKYTALQVSPDDIFTKYLSESPYGLPNESITQLKNMGVTDKALGQSGIAGSFQDRYNTRNAIQSLRHAENLWDQTSLMAKIPGLSNFGAANAAYNSAKTIIGDHLSSLIPGAPNAQASAQGLLSTLPSEGDLTQLDSAKAHSQFSAVEDQLLSSKGYKYSDIGLSPRPQAQQQSAGAASSASAKGGDILQNGLQDIVNMGKSGAKTGFDALRNAMPTAAVADLDPTGNVRSALSKIGVLPSENSGKQAISLASGITNEYAHALGLVDKNGQIAKSGDAIKQNALEHLSEHPVNTAADALGPLLGLKGMVDSNAAGVEAPQATKAPAISGNPIMDFLNPNRAISRQGNARAQGADLATTAQKTISGNDLLQHVTDAIPRLKAGNLGQGKAIDAAVSDAESVFKDKQFTPSQIADMYKETDSGYTKTGVQKTPIQANIDRALRDIYGKQLDSATNGQWSQATQAMAKSYQTQKSPARAAMKNSVKYGIPLAGAGAAGDIIKHLLFGE